MYLALLHSPELHSERISTVTLLGNQRFGPTKHLKVWDPHLNLHSTDQRSSARHKLSVPAIFVPKTEFNCFSREAIGTL